MAVVGAVLAAPVPGAHGAAALAAATCQGRTATIVGSPDRVTLRGTPGDDVIVSNGSQEVAAGAGDDTVCMTGRSAAEGYGPSVDGGSGDDSVTASLGTEELLFVSLGAGADSFAGGRESDLVAGGAFMFEDDDVASDSDTDVIDTGAGYDLVQVGDRGPLADRVHVHSPRATVQAYASGLVGGGSLSGGPRSTLTVVDDSPGADGAWALDLPSGTATLGAAPVLAWTGFGRFVWAVPGTLDVRGTDEADVVVGPVVSGSLGAGDDAVYAWSSKTDHGTHVTPVDGGSGRDTIRVLAASHDDDPDLSGGGLVPFTPSDVTVDVAHQRTVFSTGEAFGLTGFEWYGAQTDGVATLVGSAGDDVLYGSACDLRMRGGSGDDTLRQVANVHSGGFGEPSCSSDGSGEITHLSGGPGHDIASAEAGRSVVRGGPGDDRLSGGGGRDLLSGGAGDDRLSGDDRADVLVGGSGTDLGRGGRGDDTCRVEYGSDCEHPSPATDLASVPPGSHPHAVHFVDPRGDVSHLDDPRHPQDSTPAPDVRAGDVIAVRTGYRHGELTFVTRFRSLRTSDQVWIGIDLQYENSIQFLYGSVGVDVPPNGPAHATAQTDSGGCRPDLRVDRAEAVVKVSLDASCIDDARWVRAAVRTYVTDDLDAPSYYTLDAAPDAHGQLERFGPAAWAGQP